MENGANKGTEAGSARVAWDGYESGTLGELVGRYAPTGAAAAIVAEWRVDDSDPRTDYFGSHATGSIVIIGWRTGVREDFRQMRRAAAAWGPTAHLDAKDEERRENYSMGAGNYLGSKYSGWMVRSRERSLVARVFGRDRAVIAPCALPVVAPAVRAGSGEVFAGSDGAVVTLNAAKAGVEIRFPSRPEAAVLDALKRAGWRWSRFGGCWYKRQGPGVLVEAWELTGSGPEAPAESAPDVEAVPVPEAPVEAPEPAPVPLVRFEGPAGVAWTQPLEDPAVPVPGKVYRLTGTDDQPSVMRGDALPDCEVPGAHVIPFRRS